MDFLGDRAFAKNYREAFNRLQPRYEAVM